MTDVTLLRMDMNDCEDRLVELEYITGIIKGMSLLDKAHEGEFLVIVKRLRDVQTTVTKYQRMLQAKYDGITSYYNRKPVKKVLPRVGGKDA